MRRMQSSIHPRHLIKIFGKEEFLVTDRRVFNGTAVLVLKAPEASENLCVPYARGRPRVLDMTMNKKKARSAMMMMMKQ